MSQFQNTEGTKKYPFPFLTNRQGSPLATIFAYKENVDVKRSYKAHMLTGENDEENYSYCFFTEMQFSLSDRPNTIFNDNTIALASNDDNFSKNCSPKHKSSLNDHV
jgi:hypothetical protein